MPQRQRRDLSLPPGAGAFVARRRWPLSWWAPLTAIATPVLLIGGWTLAAALQPAPVDAGSVTLSALAQVGMPHRWVMTVALALVGVCHVLTALGLGTADPVGRSILACGGCATIAIAVIPLGGAGQSRLGHAFFTAVAFLALAAWPALAGRRGTNVPLTLRPGVGVGVAALLLALVGRTGAELALDGPALGVWERVAAGAESVWPLVCVTGVLFTRRAGSSRAAGSSGAAGSSWRRSAP